MELFSVENLIALLTLSSLEIVLGIDNLVFIAILTSRLPLSQQSKARKLGLSLALGTRILLLLSINWVMSLKSSLFTLLEHEVTGRDLILLIGGLFLIAKATSEIHHKMEDANEANKPQKALAKFGMIIIQIALLDIVFSLDSVITAVGMAKEISIMITAVILAMIVMLAFSGSVVKFIEKHPTLKILALSFLLLIGVMLLMEGLGKHVPKGYIYFSMAFALFVEILNIRIRKVGPHTVTPSNKALER